MNPAAYGSIGLRDLPKDPIAVRLLVPLLEFNQKSIDCLCLAYVKNPIIDVTPNRKTFLGELTPWPRPLPFPMR
jgi:hypothetical protein